MICSPLLRMPPLALKCLCLFLVYCPQLCVSLSIGQTPATWQTSSYAPFKAVVLAAEEERRCEGEWEASSSWCPASCFLRHTFKSTVSRSACPWKAGDFRLVYCEGGDCPDWRTGALLSVKGEEKNNLLVDKDLNTKVELSDSADWLQLQLANPVDVEAIKVYINPASVSLRLSILDVDNNWVSVLFASFAASAAGDAGEAPQGWITTDLSLRRVNKLQLTAAPTGATAATNWSVEIVEVELIATPALPCAGGGFSDEENDCETTQVLPNLLTDLDCKGEWEEWSVCDSNCTRRRQFRVTSPPKKGGKPCTSFAVEPCSDGDLCSLSTSAKYRESQASRLLKGPRSLSVPVGSEGVHKSGSSSDCVSLLSPKSQCVSCRTRQTYQVTQQGTGLGRPCPSDPFVLEYCDDQCAAVYGSTTTTSTPAAFTIGAASDASARISINLQNDEDAMLLIKTMAVYFSIAILACICTAYMVGTFEEDQQNPGKALKEQNAAQECTLLPAAATRASASLTPGTPRAAAVKDKRRSTNHGGASLAFGTAVRRISQAVVGGDLLADVESSGSDSDDSVKAAFHSILTPAENRRSTARKPAPRDSTGRSARNAGSNERFTVPGA